MINANEAARYINIWLNKNGYNDVFKGSTSTLLSENRRETRPKTNAAKYGKIPYHRFDNGRVGYEIADIKLLCSDHIQPFCAKLMAIRAAKLAGMSYYIAGAVI